jgi:hypothetical protein
VREPRDFVTENAIAAILASPRSKAKPAEKNLLKEPGFGRRPAYLDKIAAQLAAEREYVLELMSAAQHEATQASAEKRVREMGDDERALLIKQLKDKFTEVNHVRKAERTCLAPHGLLTWRGMLEGMNHT